MTNDPDKPLTVSLESYELSEDAGSYGVDVMAKIELLHLCGRTRPS